MSKSCGPPWAFLSSQNVLSVALLAGWHQSTLQRYTSSLLVLTKACQAVSGAGQMDRQDPDPRPSSHGGAVWHSHLTPGLQLNIVILWL